MEEIKKQFLKSFLSLFQHEKKIETQRQLLFSSLAKFKLVFNPFQFLLMIKGQSNIAQIPYISIEDLQRFLNSKMLTFDERVMKKFFSFYGTDNKIDCNNIIKLITPQNFIFDALERDFTSLELIPLNIEIEKEFTKLMILELSLCLFQVEQYFSSMKAITQDEVNQIFQKGNNIEEKMVFFLKQEFETNLADKDLKLLFLKIKRSGIEKFEIQNLFLFPELRIFKKIEIIEEIPQEPLQGLKLKETPLDIQFDVKPENLQNFFTDQNKSVFQPIPPPQPEKTEAKEKPKGKGKKSDMPISKGKGKIQPKKSAVGGKKAPVKSSGRKSVTPGKKSNANKSMRKSVTPGKKSVSKTGKKGKSVINESINLSNLDVSQIVKNTISDDAKNTINDISLLDNQFNDVFKTQEFNPLNQVMTIKEKEAKDKNQICNQIFDLIFENVFIQHQKNIRKQQREEKEKRQKEEEKSIIGDFIKKDKFGLGLSDDPFMHQQRFQPQRNSVLISKNNPYLTNRYTQNNNIEQSYNQSYLQKSYIQNNDQSMMSYYKKNMNPQDQLKSFLGMVRGDTNKILVSQSEQSNEKVVLLLRNLFKKILIYNSKLEDLRKKIFEESINKVDLIKLFDEFDENKDGLCDLVEFKFFLQFMGFKISDSRITRVLYYLREDQSLQAINFIDFVKIYVPWHWDQDKTYQYFFEQSVQQSQLQKQEFQEMRKILIILFKKIDDLTKITQQILKHSIEEITYAINQNHEKKVTLKNLTRFLEENDVNFIEEDLTHILNEFSIEKSLEISAEKFYQYFTKEVWKLKIQNQII